MADAVHPAAGSRDHGPSGTGCPDDIDGGRAVEPGILDAYLAAFSPLSLVPVIAPAALRAGDAVTGLDAALLARRQDCFSAFVAWDAPAVLPVIELPARAAARFALGAAAGDPALDALDDRTTALRFDEVTVETVSRTALRENLRPEAHPAVALLFAHRPAVPDDNVMLLGQVYAGTCTLRLDRRRDGLPMPALLALAARAGLRLKPVGGTALRHAEAVDLGPTQRRLIAWRPALIDSGPLTPDTFRTINQMRPPQAARNFDQGNEADRLALVAWVERQRGRLAASADRHGGPKG